MVGLVRRCGNGEQWKERQGAIDGCLGQHTYQTVTDRKPERVPEEVFAQRLIGPWCTALKAMTDRRSEDAMQGGINGRSNHSVSTVDIAHWFGDSPIGFRITARVLGD